MTKKEECNCLEVNELEWLNDTDIFCMKCRRVFRLTNNKA